MMILHVIASANLAEGGPIEQAIRSGETLTLRGHQQDFITIDPPGLATSEEIPGQIYAFGSLTPHGNNVFARLARQMKCLIRAVTWLRKNARRYDVVIVSGLWNLSTVIATWSLVSGATPYVVYTHGMLDPWFNKRYPLKSAIKQMLWFVNEGVLLRNATRVLFTCDEERRLARTSFWPYRARERVVIYGTADAPDSVEVQSNAFREAMPVLGDRRFILFLSRIHEKKGIDLLIEAFNAVAMNYADVDLVIAGPDSKGLQKILERRVAALGLSHRVHWPGMLTGDVKWGAFRECDAFILPSHQENFGIVVAEAMACGRPVLITNKVNIWREIDKDQSGFVANDDQNGINMLLSRFLAMDDSPRKDMSSRARSSFLSRFHIDASVDDLESVLLEVAASSPSRNKKVSIATESIG
jgi:glycosyltransferase involved in cell wall biosynthesis